ncbi:hypothetical protein EJV47_11520 [Hymenobacter gummosus]|uniref:Uncharacterized protein n=1 Tax=Hymenobacter gummosus TaxID=1776032 RepID=A0A431U3R6_9BACT|nr:hypothetical protein [Hymenobacter gummosus]RTQ50249.1 hypothetical protein EJV47_11520 [Hymenobacter gummosus]
MKFGEGGLQSNIISTSHKRDNEVGAGILLINSPLGRTSDLRGYDHSHPDGEWRPSGAVHAPGTKERQFGDIVFAQNLQQIHRGASIELRVYTATDRKYFPYNKDTYVPMMINEINITGKKPRK